jgi:hypothetical protein
MHNKKHCTCSLFPMRSYGRPKKYRADIYFNSPKLLQFKEKYPLQEGLYILKLLRSLNSLLVG